MFTSKKSAKIYLSVLLMTLLLWGTGAADRLGVLISEPDGNPADSYVYKIIFPNGTTSITGNVLTYTAAGIVTTQAVTVADSGADSDAAAFNLTPTAAQIVAVAITCNDDDGCTGTMIETSATHGDIVNVMNLSTYAVSFAYSAGVLEHQGGTGNSLVLNQYNSITLKYQTDRWVCIGNESSTIYIQSLAIPTLKASELNDTSDPHLLTVAELKNTIISNSESTGADEWDFPARTEGWNFIFAKEADQDITLDPNGTEQWYFRTTSAAYTQLAAGEALVNTTAGKSTLTCFSTEAAVYCTGDANWAEESP